MLLITTQSAKWRNWDKDRFLFVDTTLSWGDKTFSPYPELLTNYKAGLMEWSDYVVNYKLHMRKQYREHKARFLELVHSDKPVVIACACPPDKPCHRYLLKDILAKIAESENVRFQYLGEHTDPTSLDF